MKGVSVTLARERVAWQRMRIRGYARGTRQRVANTDDGPPLGKTGTHGAVLGEPIAQTIKALGNAPIRRSGERFGAGIYLDARKNTVVGENFRKWGPGGTLLVKGFVAHDGTADEGGGARGGKEHLAVGAPAVFG